MRIQNRLGPILLLAAILATTLPLSVDSRIERREECDFNVDSPSVDNARLSFRAGEYFCARRELEAVLALDTIPARVRANAHGVMAAVNYATTFDPRERRQRTRLEFIAAFRAFRYWRDKLEIPEYEFRQIMKDAREVTEWVYRNAPTAESEEPPAPVDTVTEIAAVAEQPTPPVIKTKPWYKKWWAIGSGVGLFALAITMLSRGDNEVIVGKEPVVVDTLPDFPPPP
jgi:hypothetical protein